MSGGAPAKRARYVLARGYEALAAASAAGETWDLVIVGSGYGASVAAEAFARRVRAHDSRPLRIAVLERGEERLAGSFPAGFSDLPGELRFARAGARRHGGKPGGLFDLRLGADVTVLVANGLGGGSLINAGVMEPPSEATMRRPEWPAVLREMDPAERRRWFERAYEVLGLPADGTLPRPGEGRHVDPDGVPKTPERSRKGRALETIARASGLPVEDAVPGTPVSGAVCRPVPTTVAGPWGGSRRGDGLRACIGCGDCATGCNHDAKDSLDRGPLARAAAAGVSIFVGSTVTGIVPRPAVPGRPDAPRWSLVVAPTEPMLTRRLGPAIVHARRVIVAAGTLGSTELLMRSRQAAAPRDGVPATGLRVSARLGERVGSNGDAIHAICGFPDPVGTAADERRAPARRGIGPTISTMLDLRDAPTVAPVPMVVQDLGVPGGLGTLFGETVTTSLAFARLADGDPSPHAHGRPSREPYAVQAHVVRRTALVAMMGDDGAAGRVAEPVEGAGPGTATVDWPQAGDQPVFDAQIDVLKKLVGRLAPVRGQPPPTVLPNPGWRLLPPNVERMIGKVRGPLFSVHPLGGCAMGRGALDGVVDDLGRVFDADAPDGAVLDGLAVLDGAIVPCALGINPALTITMLAVRASRLLWTEDWPEAPAAPVGAAGEPPPRPVYAIVDAQAARPAEPTEVEIVERLVGHATLATAEGPRDCRIELTLRFEPARLRELATRHGTRLRVAGTAADAADAPPAIADARPSSELRLLDRDVLAAAARDPAVGSLDQADVRAAATLFAAPVTGSLRVLVREATRPVPRAIDALWAWGRNRGARDALQGGGGIAERVRREALKPILRDGRLHPPSWPRRLLRTRAAQFREYTALLRDLWRIATRAGEARRFEYVLRLGAPTEGGGRAFPALDAGGGRLELHKRFAYVRRGNPFNQLSRATIDVSPFGVSTRNGVVLSLDTAWLASRRIPLMRLVRMESLPDAYADIAALAATVARMSVGIHLWSFRKPEPPVPRVPQRLPGPLPLARAERRDGPDDDGERELVPEIVWLPVDAGRRDPDEPPAGGEGTGRVAVRLARYRFRDARFRPDAPPIVTFHGYSASGTTFAHPSLEPSFARYFAERGRDVWVADLRTSSGIEATGRRPWRFEDVAWNDVPAIVAHVCAATGRPQVDVVAHCMGAVMVSMAVLRPDGHDGPWRAELDALPGRIRRAVLSQGGPVLCFSPANRLRAYVMSRKRMLLGDGEWDFRAAVPPTAADDLMDRLLSPMPYRDDTHFDLENPMLRPDPSRTAYVRTRHRLDALFGETFPLAPIPQQVLDAIDDFFGPIHLETVAQTIRFALDQRAASAVGPTVPGHEIRTDPAFLARRWTFPTRHFVGEHNGLLDASTVTAANHAFRHLGDRYLAQTLEGFGHQDVLIGRDTLRFFDGHVAPFLEPEPRGPTPGAPAAAATGLSTGGPDAP